MSYPSGGLKNSVAGALKATDSDSLFDCWNKIKKAQLPHTNRQRDHHNIGLWVCDGSTELLMAMKKSCYRVCLRALWTPMGGFNPKVDHV